VVQKISRRVIRTLRHLRYLEAGIDDTVATAYDPLLDNEPTLARTMAASVQQRIAFGERAGQQVRRQQAFCISYPLHTLDEVSLTESFATGTSSPRVIEPCQHSSSL
jgi:hypothetical protein